MRHSTIERDEVRTRKIFLGVFYFCAATMAAITFYAIYVNLVQYSEKQTVAIGEVLEETEFPLHGLAKLVTYLMIVSVVGWYCVVRLGRDKVRGIPKWLKAILQLLVLAIAVIAFYEFIYNFVIWNSLITAEAIKGAINPDKINTNFPDPKTPWNLVFATKMSLTAFFIAAHGFYTMSKQEKNKNLQE